MGVTKANFLEIPRAMPATSAIIRSDITWYFNFKIPEKNILSKTSSLKKRRYYLINQVKTPEKNILPNTSS